MDKIKIKNLEVFAKHGVFPEERVLGQKFVISAVLYTDTRAAGCADDLLYSIHYGEVCQFVNSYMQEHTFQLIERVAETLAEELLITFKRLRKIRIEVQKPWAPIGLPLDSVSVEIERQWHRVFVAMGSNIGDSRRYIEEAVDAIRTWKGCNVRKVSALLETKPYGMIEQPDFLNGCMEIETLLTPEELLEKLHLIERAAGRERKVHWGPRTLDLDILFYDDCIIHTDLLCIPHIDMQNRDFVLIPLKEIAPYYFHPVFHQTVAQLEAALKDRALPR